MLYENDTVPTVVSTDNTVYTTPVSVPPSDYNSNETVVTDVFPTAVHVYNTISTTASVSLGDYNSTEAVVIVSPTGVHVYNTALPVSTALVSVASGVPNYLS
jgi:hypothetical protein